MLGFRLGDSPQNGAYWEHQILGCLDGRSFGTNFIKEHICYRSKQSHKQAEHTVSSLYMPVSHPGRLFILCSCITCKLNGIVKGSERVDPLGMIECFF